MSKKVVILDYGMGNLRSIARACDRVKLENKISNNSNEILSADALILPGVGSYSRAMKNIEKLGLETTIKLAVKKNKYLLGICLGMQLLMDYSLEFGKHSGLGLISGSCEGFNKYDVKVPHVNWNQIQMESLMEKKNSFFKGINNLSEMYFVHSYYVKPKDSRHTIASTIYGNTKFTSALNKDKIYGVQFHPEKSSEVGIQFYRNFKKLIENG